MQRWSHWVRFRVRTLDKARFDQATAELAARVGAFKPDILVGIRTGGYVVADTMAPHFPQTVLLPFTCRRPSTQKKQKSACLKELLRTLPGVITGGLRIAEHIFLTQLRPPKQGIFTPEAAELAAIGAHVRALGHPPRILIVDDSVDSGATLAAAVANIQEVAGPDAIIKTATITVTTAMPTIEPNFMLYRYVLCRFPWSLDFRN